jgi:SAM-dependent methyltransferase
MMDGATNAGRGGNVSERAMYDAFAEEYAAHAETGVYNAMYDRPAVLELCGSVAGLRVLDAGCGPGLYARALIERGALVTAFDASASLVELARQRLGDDADVRVHDLEHPPGLGADRKHGPRAAGVDDQLRG